MFVSDLLSTPPLLEAMISVVLAMTFDKPQDFNAYLVHPKHLQILKRYGPPVFKDMIAYQVDGSAPKSKL
ncbi:hypothetical protein L226DRAFT_527816 [Lentinus tigrinus ALCF2SS1-7]|uniref:uncharacterized protein n=1 Tax=Lentinus tigrinus ALCF2SS1-7 TaxID=1328758 RepID=UPI0011663538|nr:hypothetical protein L226DRAFT_527816 [Lentinus tigrinus ALCF2SS1-7]